MIEHALRDGWSVLVAGLAFGAGMPVIYALAMRARVTGALITVGPDGEEQVQPRRLATAAAVALLLVIVAIVALGITMIAASGFGKTVSFEYIFIPVIVDQ